MEEQNLVRRKHELVRTHPRYGYRFITAKLRQEGLRVSFKQVYPLWHREGLQVPRKTRKARRLGHCGNSCVCLCYFELRVYEGTECHSSQFLADPPNRPGMSSELRSIIV